MDLKPDVNDVGRGLPIKTYAVAQYYKRLAHVEDVFVGESWGGGASNHTFWARTSSFGGDPGCS